MKKAEMTIETIVWIILALLVLVVLVIAFRSQIGELFKAFTQLITGTVENTQNIDLNSIGG